jgi:hypothetical protein
VQALSLEDPAYSVLAASLHKYMNTCTDVLNFVSFPASKQTKIQIEISGKDKFPKVGPILKSCGDLLTDFKCFESTCSACSCLSSTSSQFEGVKAEFTFDAKAIKEMNEENKDCPTFERIKQFRIHAVPLSVLVRYPELFQRNELRGSPNLVAFPDHFSIQQKYDATTSFYEDWSTFFRQHEHATRDEIEEHARSLLKNQNVSESYKPTTTPGRSGPSDLFRPTTGAPIPNSQ